MKRFILILLLSVAVDSTFAQLGFSLADGATRVDIPIEIHNNLVVVPVVINNQLPLKFILDTGVRTTILTEKIYSDILHLTYSKKFTISALGGENLLSAYITNNVTIDMPGVHGRGHAMLVLEKDYLELRHSLGSEVHGILGYELFSRFVIKINYQAKVLTLMLPKKFKPSRKYSRLPITVEDTKPYYVAELKLNDTTSISAKLLIDTGASQGLFLDTESNKKIIVPQKNLNCVLGKGLGGDINGRIGRINSLSIGRYIITDMIASFPDPNSYFDSLRSAKSNVYRNGSLGGDVLSRFNIIFDFPHEKIFVKSNASFKKKPYYDMTGLTVRAIGERLHDFEVSRVRATSPAHLAGVQVGDKVLAINETSTFNMSLSELNSYFATKPGKKVTMRLLRGTVVIEKEFTLVEEI